MGDYRSSSHVYWRCKYHIVWTPKFRFKILKGNVAKELNRSIYILCNMKDCGSARSCPLSCDNSAQSIDFDVDGSFKG